MRYKVTILPISPEKSTNFNSEKVKNLSIWKISKIFYQNFLIFILIPCQIVAFWRGTWDLLDHYHQFFPMVPSYLISAIVTIILELIRSTYISNRLKILDDDSKATIIKKNLALSFYDVFYNVWTIIWWRALWGHPEVSPLVVGFWRGLWSCIEYYDHEYRIFPLWKWLSISFAVSTFIYYNRDHLNDKIISGNESHVDSIYLKGLKRVLYYRVYHYIFAFSSIMIWRCLWEITPRYWGPGVYPAIILSIVCFIPLVVMRSARNLVAPPILIITDSKEFAFNFPTRYRIDLIILNVKELRHFATFCHVMRKFFCLDNFKFHNVHKKFENQNL
ncbi:hypothetical protein PVAND_006639 [Polypedilum vanderplanki]|uniref:Uncharacterized protein n=1 Tax=Polypedilum vanderplanki TaxID=319348 RepID=A0A9J6C4Q6_POLVA|nr:hypothetical protein PVAND_006639 [Polypedilum vanderplanki]